MDKSLAIQREIERLDKLFNSLMFVDGNGLKESIKRFKALEQKHKAQMLSLRNEQQF